MNAEQKKKKNYTSLAILVVALALTAFQLYTAGISMLTAWIQRDIHIVLILILVFLIFPLRKKGEKNKASLLDVLLILLALASGAYIIMNYQAIVLRLGMPTTEDIVFGAIMILLILEASRRATGWVLVIIAGVLLIYTFLGPWIPGLLGHKGYSLGRCLANVLNYGGHFRYTLRCFCQLHLSVYIFNFHAGEDRDGRVPVRSGDGLWAALSVVPPKLLF